MIFILADQFLSLLALLCFCHAFFVLVKCYIVYKTVIQGVCPVASLKNHMQ